MWSVAIVSMTQSKFLKASLLTFLVKNIECDRLGLKRKLEEVPDMRSEQGLAEELTCDCEENTSKVPPYKEFGNSLSLNRMNELY